MGGIRDKLRKWTRRFFGAVLFIGVVLVFAGVFEDISSQFGNRPAASRAALGLRYGDSPIEEMRWRGVEEVAPGSAAEKAGIEPGDGIKFDRVLGESFTWKPGEQAGVTVYREGERFKATLTAQAPPPSEANEGISFLGWMILFLEPLLVGFIALLLVRGIQNRAAALLGVSMLFWPDVGLSLLPNWTVAPLTLFLAMPIRSAALYCWPIFAMEISGGAANSRMARLVPRAGLALAVAFFAFTIMSNLRMPSPVAPEFLFIATYLVDLALGLGIIVVNYQRNDPAGRNRIKIVLAAFGILFLGIITAILLGALGIVEDAWGWMILICLGTALVLLGYATLNRQLFDFGFAVNRTLVYGAAAFTLLVTFGLVEYIAKSMIPVAWPTAGPFISAGLAVLLFLSFHRLHHWFEHHIERFFFRQWQEAEKALKRFVESASHFDQVSGLCNAAVDAVSAFAGGSGAALYLRESNGNLRRVAGKLAGAPESFAGDNPAFALMRAERKPLDLPQAPGALPGELALPMVEQGGLEGFMLLGGRPDGTYYRPDQVELLDWAMHHVGLDLRALHARQLEQQVITLKAQSEEKDRLIALMANVQGAFKPT